MTGHDPLRTPVAAPAAAAAVAAFVLDGRPCRIVCVDDLVPSQQLSPGSTRPRQRYRSDEVAHFQFGAHRYALVADEVPAEARRDGRRESATPEIHALLTTRELQIVQLVCTGLLTKQVSDRLHISEFTVRSYLKTIYCKLGVRSRGAMVYAYAQSFARTVRFEDAPANAPSAGEQAAHGTLPTLSLLPEPARDP